MAEIIVTLDNRELQRFSITKDRVAVGRSADNDIVLENPSVSRGHACITHEAGRYILTDLDSSNGTCVNGVPITRTEIRHEDIVLVGQHVLRFLAPETSDEGLLQDVGEMTLVLDQATSEAFLTVKSGKQRSSIHKIVKQTARIGRSKDNDIRVIDWFIELHQAIINKEGFQYRFRNLSETIPVQINNETMAERILEDNDVILMGGATITFCTTAEGAEAARDSRVSDRTASFAVPSKPHIDTETFVVPGDEPHPFAPESDEKEPPAPEFGMALDDVLPEDTEEAPIEAEPLTEEELEIEEELPVEEEADLVEVEAPVEEDVDLLEVEAPIEEEEAVEAEAFVIDEEPEPVDAEAFPIEEEYPPPLEPSEETASAVDAIAAMAEMPFEEEEETAPEEDYSAEPEPEQIPPVSEEVSYSLEETPPLPEEEPLPPVVETAPAFTGEDTATSNLLADTDSNEPDEHTAKKIAFWEKALLNPSPAVSKQAAVQLKRLTGRDYD